MCHLSVFILVRFVSFSCKRFPIGTKNSMFRLILTMKKTWLCCCAVFLVSLGDVMCQRLGLAHEKD